MSHLNQRQRTPLTTALTALLVLLTASPALAGDDATRDWAANSKGVGERATANELIPTMGKEEAYLQRYNFAARLDNGGYLKVDFTISNMGWGDRNAAARVYLRSPDLDRDYSYSNKVDERSWKSAKDHFMLDISKTTVEAKDDRTFVITHRGEVELELTFESLMPMWKPGRGQLDVKDGYYRFHLISPRAKVTGRAKIKGAWVPLVSTSKGYGDHIDTNVAPYDFAQRFSRSRHFNGDLFIIWREITLSKEYGGESVVWLMIGYKDKIVFSDPRAKLRIGQKRTDAKTGYVLPYAVQVDAAQGADKVKLVMRGKRMKKTDLLKSYGNAVRLVASAVSAPFRYEFPCSYALQMEIQGARAQVRGQSHYTFDYVKK